MVITAFNVFLIINKVKLLRLQEARKYHISLQVLAEGQAPAAAVALSDPTAESIRPDQVGPPQNLYLC